MAEPFTIYKLTILYMLDKAGFPLSNTQLSNFFLEYDYTDYFRVQEVIGNLVDSNLIIAESTHSNTQYTLTTAGKETILKREETKYYSAMWQKEIGWLGDGER